MPQHVTGRDGVGSGVPHEARERKQRSWFGRMVKTPGWGMFDYNLCFPRVLVVICAKGPILGDDLGYFTSVLFGKILDQSSFAFPLNRFSTVANCWVTPETPREFS